MNDLLGSLKELYNCELSIFETTIKNNVSEAGVELSLKLQSGEVIASGCGDSRDMALRICIAEAFERGLAIKISRCSNLKKEFHIVEFPTTCGFAAGFERGKTKFRAVAEGIERWAWSQWIDYKCALDETKLEKQKVNDLSKIFLANFLEYRCYQKSFTLSLNEKDVSFELAIFLGLTDHGIFPGSRVSTKGNSDTDWNHAILEAFRCLKNFKLNCSIDCNQQDIIARRAIYFGSNKDLAFSQIEKSQVSKNQFPKLKLALLKEYRTDINQVYLWRCLMADYLGWHLGSIERFVY